MKSNNKQGYSVRGGKIYVQGSIDGVFKRYSTGLDSTKQNLTYIKRNHRSELEKIYESKTVKKTVSTMFLDYALDYLSISNRKRKPNTAKEYNQIFDKRIKPSFEHYSLKEIKRQDLKVWQQSLVDEGLSAKRVNNIRSVFNNILSEALKDELIEKNYFTTIDKEKLKKVDITPFSLDEVQLILNSIDDSWQKDFITIAFFTGMRTGEIVALKWDDINFVSKTIRVSRSIRKGIVGDTKTDASDRTIDMLPLVEDAILSMKKRTFLRNSFIFLNEAGKNFYDGAIVRDGVWKNTLKLCGLDYRTLYQTRHTFASIMISKGEDIGWVSNMLGHANLQITLTTYAKYIKSDKTARATFLDGFKTAQNEQTVQFSNDNNNNGEKNNFSNDSENTLKFKRVS